MVEHILQSNWKLSALQNILGIYMFQSRPDQPSSGTTGSLWSMMYSPFFISDEQDAHSYTPLDLRAAFTASFLAGQRYDADLNFGIRNLRNSL